MKDVVVEFEARQRVSGRQLIADSRRAAKLKDDVGVVGKFKSGLKYLVQKSHIILF